MFPSDDVCQRSLQDLAAEGFDRKRLTANLRRLAEAGFLSREPGSGVVPDTYRLHLPQVQQ
jgi:DNA-binding HxlR family transcriptional regulator